MALRVLSRHYCMVLHYKALEIFLAYLTMFSALSHVASNSKIICKWGRIRKEAVVANFNNPVYLPKL
jgi:hypothetical protein